MSYQITDPVEIQEALTRLVNYGYEEEVKDFERKFCDDEINGFHGFDSQGSIEDAIEEIKAIEGGTEHILYSMLVLKSAYEIEHED